jgi:hypothetical protein
MASCLFRVKALATGATSGTCNLTSNLWYGNETYLRIPIGMTAKIHQVSTSGPEETRFDINHTHDCTGTPTWVVYDEIYLAQAGHLDVAAESRPWTFYSYDGKQGIRVTWAGQSTATDVYCHLTIELVDDLPRR